MEPDTAPPPALEPDRFAGMVFGCALGDALGLQCKGETPDSLRNRFPEGVKLPYEGGYRGFEPNDWTDKTDQLILGMRALLGFWDGAEVPGTPGGLDNHIASHLHGWSRRGFAELKDKGANGIDNITWQVTDFTDFVRAPFDVAQQTTGNQAGGVVLFRALPVAALPTPAEAEEVTLCFTAATHRDPQCIAACIFLVHLLRALLMGYLPAPNLVGFPGERALEYLPPPPAPGKGPQPRDGGHRAVFKHALNEKSKSLEALELDSRDQVDHVYKTLGCAMWALRQLLRHGGRRETPWDDTKTWGPGFFMQRLQELALSGRDSDAHCGIAGAVFGAVLGYPGLPKTWGAALPHSQWLGGEINRYLSVVVPPPPEEIEPDPSEQ